MQNINSVLFLAITNSTFSNCIPVLKSFSSELPIFLREYKNGMYRVIIYYLAKFLNEVRINFYIRLFFFLEYKYLVS